MVIMKRIGQNHIPEKENLKSKSAYEAVENGRYYYLTLC